jgi:hypothetical protein
MHRRYPVRNGVTLEYARMRKVLRGSAIPSVTGSDASIGSEPGAL